jgi:two-component system sensor histidine kinase DesK
VIPIMPSRWADLGRVERVDLYTRQSLHLILWLFCGTLLLNTGGTSTGGAERAVLVGGGITVTVLGSIAMRAVIAGWPAARPVPWSPLIALVLVAGTYFAVVGLPAGDDTRGAVTFLVLANVCAAFGGLPDHRVTAGLLLLAGLVSGASGGAPSSVVAGVAWGALVIFSVRVSLWLLRIVTELDVARSAQAQLAVAEERLRFSRDVHDVLGRRLSTIAVQSELAATLAARGDDRAPAKMLEVRAGAHDALQEVRELARGYRPTNLSHELEGARSLLHSAGIRVELDLDVVPRGWHEAAAWVVRESVTNVLRHSHAEVVSIGYRDGELRVENDGALPDVGAADGAVAPDGSGLAGVRERLQALGASLLTQRSGECWSVVAHLPGAGPISALSNRTDRPGGAAR